MQRIQSISINQYQFMLAESGQFARIARGIELSTRVYLLARREINSNSYIASPAGHFLEVDLNARRLFDEIRRRALLTGKTSPDYSRANLLDICGKMNRANRAITLLVSIGLVVERKGKRNTLCGPIRQSRSFQTLLTPTLSEFSWAKLETSVDVLAAVEMGFARAGLVVDFDHTKLRKYLRETPKISIR